MKKINKTFFTIMTLLLLPIGVNADMGLPEIQPYEAYVTNPTGIVVECGIEEKEYTIKQNDKVKVIHEYEDDIEIQYNNEHCNGDITISDIKPIVDVYNPKDYLNEVDKLEKPKKIKIIEDNGVDLYSGPSTAFKKISNIPNDTELTYTYSSGDDNGLKPIWLYVEYKGQTGWIKTGKGADSGNYLLFEFKNELPILLDTNLVISENNQIKIPKGTVINKGYMRRDSFGGQFNTYYIEYDNNFGYLSLEYDFAGKQSIILLDDMSMYDTLKHTVFEDSNYNYKASMSGSKILTIPKGTTLTYDIGVYDYTYTIAYVEYNGKNGWILLEESLDENTNSNFEYVENNNEDNDNVEDDNNDETTITTTTTKPIIKNEKETLSAKELIYLCVGAAVIISLTAIVTIVLVNKNNKSKNNEIINNTQE